MELVGFCKCVNVEHGTGRSGKDARPPGANEIAGLEVRCAGPVTASFWETDGDVKCEHVDLEDSLAKLDQVVGDEGSVESPILEDDDYPAALRDIGSCDEDHGDTVAEFGIGFAYPLGPGKSSVITSVVSGDPVKSGFWGAIQGDD